MKKLFISTCFILSTLFVASGSGFTFQCDKNLIPSGKFQIKYRDRGNRCEGFYLSQVSAGGFNVAGFVIGSFKYELDPNEMITLTSSIVEKTPVNIRSIAIPLRDYYRMDASIQPKSALEWPVNEVLAPAKIPYTKIGVFGWVEIEGLTYYVPVKAVSNLMKQGAPDNRIRIYIRPWKNVQQLGWQIADDDNGMCGPFTKPTPPDEEKQVYLEGQAVQITLPENNSSKKMCLKIFALEENSSTWIPPGTFHLLLGD